MKTDVGKLIKMMRSALEISVKAQKQKSEMSFERGVKKVEVKYLPATRKWAQTDTSPLLKPFFNMRLGESL